METKIYLMPYAKIVKGKAENLMNIDNIEFENIIAFSAKASMGAGKTTFYNMLKAVAGAKFTEKPLQNGKEKGMFEAEILASNGENWKVEYYFDKENNFPVLKTFLKNGEKATKKDFAQMIKEVEPNTDFDVNKALSLTGKAQFEYFAKTFEIDIKKEEKEYNDNFEIRANFNREKNVLDARYLRLNKPNYDIKQVESLKKHISELENLLSELKQNETNLILEQTTLSAKIEKDLELKISNLENKLQNLQTERQNYNSQIENKEANLRILENAKKEIENQSNIIKKYIPNFVINYELDLSTFKQGEKAPISRYEVDNFAIESFENLPAEIQENLKSRKELINQYSGLKKQLTEKDFNSFEPKISEIENKLAENKTKFSETSEKINLSKETFEKLQVLKSEYDKFLTDQKAKDEYEKALQVWQDQDLKTNNSLQKVIDKLNSFEFADKELKFNGFVNDRGHLEIILKYGEIDFSAKSEGEKAIIGAYLHASLIKKGELGLVFISAKYTSKSEVDKLVKYLVSKGLQPYLEFTVFENNKNLSIDHYLDFEEKDF